MGAALDAIFLPMDSEKAAQERCPRAPRRGQSMGAELDAISLSTDSEKAAQERCPGAPRRGQSMGAALDAISLPTDSAQRRQHGRGVQKRLEGDCPWEQRWMPSLCPRTQLREASAGEVSRSA
ncbi:hypothetical protein NDU88_000238 [Pleurodeles waltl]|uniref:Uncharacterized protein n=1 Tax=Pleurodeles waltl TaxID=8319 RepID=A0AAV7WEW0_PLEWA|nr:hypothetical protein NDU88_000238 [Pleurodeles waltl]